MPIDYDAIKKMAWADNIKHFNLNDPSVNTKIINWATLRGIEPDKLLLDIEQSTYFKYAFVKDPNRQNVYEKAALNFLVSTPMIKDAIKLPHNGVNALFVNKGILTPGENISRTQREEQKSKSIDFKFTIKPCGQRTTTLTCYAMHKYTDSEGGAQDNQFSDLRLFLENCPTKRLECYIAFADGEYYATRIQQLKDEFNIISKRRVFTLNEFAASVSSGCII